MSLRSQRCSSTHDGSDTTSDQGSDGSEDEVVHDGGDLAIVDALQLVVDAHVDQVLDEAGLSSDLFSDTFVDPVKNERNTEHDGGTEQAGVTPATSLDHGALVSEGVGSTVADTNTRHDHHTLSYQLQHVSQWKVGNIEIISRMSDRIQLIEEAGKCGD